MAIQKMQIYMHSILGIESNYLGSTCEGEEEIKYGVYCCTNIIQVLGWTYANSEITSKNSQNNQTTTKRYKDLVKRNYTW